LGVRETAEKVALAHENDKEKEKKKEKEKEKKSTSSFWSKRKDQKSGKIKGKGDAAISQPVTRTATLAQIDAIEKVAQVFSRELPCAYLDFFLAFCRVFFTKDSNCGGFISHLWSCGRSGKTERRG
jgi:hypothetical protein